MKKIFIPFCIAFLLFSCTPNSTPKETFSNQDSGANNLTLVRKVKEYKGVYLPGQFKNAENSELYAFSEMDRKLLDSAYNRILANPYPNQTVFMNFKGIVDSFPTNSGFKVSAITLLSMEMKSAFNPCIPYDYWCIGTEPFWQVQISEKENLIDFYDPMIPKFYHFIFTKAEKNTGTTIFSAEDKANTNKIKITITNEKCSDGMSERNYQYKSEVVLNGKTYNGCAMAFGDGLQ